MRFKASDLPPQYREQIASSWAVQPVGKNGNKYNAKETWIDNIRFASKLEARCYQELKLRQSAGEVLWFVRQIAFDIGGGVRHKVDFLAVLASGGVEVIEAKGRDIPEGKARRRQVESRYGIKIRIWTGK